MVQGLDRMTQRWGAIPGRVREAVRKEMERLANDITDDMYRLVPQLSGELASTIGWTWGDAPKGSLTIVKVGGKEYGGMQITIFAGNKDAFYARFQEFGTVNMAANPFFYPVWRVWKPKIKRRINAAIRKALRAA